MEKYNTGKKTNTQQKIIIKNNNTTKTKYQRHKTRKQKGGKQKAA